MGDKEFMYNMELGDYKYVFEYETIEELKEQIAITKELHQDILNMEQYKKVNNVIDMQKELPIAPFLTFTMLELKFVADLKEELKESGKKLSEASYKAYANTFKKLKVFFGDEDIKLITKERFKAFRKHLKDELKLNAKTINTQMIYLNMFLDFASSNELITKNLAKDITSLKETKLVKENFTDMSTVYRT